MTKTMKHTYANAQWVLRVKSAKSSKMSAIPQNSVKMEDFAKMEEMEKNAIANRDLEV